MTAAKEQVEERVEAEEVADSLRETSVVSRELKS